MLELAKVRASIVLKYQGGGLTRPSMEERVGVSFICSSRFGSHGYAPLLLLQAKEQLAQLAETRSQADMDTSK